MKKKKQVIYYQVIEKSKIKAGAFVYYSGFSKRNAEATFKTICKQKDSNTKNIQLIAYNLESFDDCLPEEFTILEEEKKEKIKL